MPFGLVFHSQVFKRNWRTTKSIGREISKNDPRNTMVNFLIWESMQFFSTIINPGERFLFILGLVLMRKLVGLI